MPVMMRGPIARQLLIMREPIVRQLREDLLYVSYDERSYCTPVMRGSIVRQL